MLNFAYYMEARKMKVQESVMYVYYAVTQAISNCDPINI